jgi:hypothetical protein
MYFLTEDRVSVLFVNADVQNVKNFLLFSSGKGNFALQYKYCLETAAQITLFSPWVTTKEIEKTT